MDYVPYSYVRWGIGARKSSAITPNGSYDFTYDGESISEHPTNKKYKVDRKAMNAVMKDYAPFRMYMKSIYGLTNGEITDEMRHAHWRHDVSQTALDDTQYWTTYLTLCRRCLGWGSNNKLTLSHLESILRSDVKWNRSTEVVVAVQVESN